MKKLLLITIFIILGSCNYAYGQISVSQQFIDDCTKAFNLVVEQREAIEKFKAERAKTDIERQTADVFINGLKELMKIKDLTLGQYEMLSQFQQQIIKFQQEIIEKLQAMLKKPKSVFDKILRTLERVAILVGGVLIGRGLGF